MKPLTGLRTERRMSHVLAFDVPNYPKPLLRDRRGDQWSSRSSDETRHRSKRDRTRRTPWAIAEPKVAVLSAIETVVPKLTSRIDAAALRKMSEWGQITGALVDGPLAFDTAVSKEAAKLNGIDSRVAGRCGHSGLS